jgi:hypothetical protein
MQSGRESSIVLNMPEDKAKRTKVPTGFLDLRAAVTSVRRRLYASGIPTWVLEAAEDNLSGANSAVRSNNQQTPGSNEHPQAMAFIVQALQSKDLVLFVYSPSAHRVAPVPSEGTSEALDSVGFLKPTRETIVYRFMDFYPRKVMHGIDVPGFARPEFDRFAFCLRERLFDNCLAATARQLRWPIDVKRHSGRGRPALGFLIKPVLQDMIDGGRWKQGMPLKSLVLSIRSKIHGEKIDRETVKRVMDEVYNETGNLARLLQGQRIGDWGEGHFARSGARSAQSRRRLHIASPGAQAGRVGAAQSSATSCMLRGRA